MQRPLVVKIVGQRAEDERTNVGVLVAATAATAGVPVVLWLAGESVHLATTVHQTNPDSDTATLLETLRQLADVYVCARCVAQRGIRQEDLHFGVSIGGAAQYVEQVLDPDVQALIY